MVRWTLALTCGLTFALSGVASAQFPMLPTPPPPLDAAWVVFDVVPQPGETSLLYPICPRRPDYGAWSCHVGINRAHCTEQRQYEDPRWDGTGYAECVVDLNTAKAECVETQPHASLYGNEYDRRCSVWTSRTGTLAECYESNDPSEEVPFAHDYERGCVVGPLSYRCHLSFDPYEDPHAPEECKLEGVPGS